MSRPTPAPVVETPAAKPEVPEVVLPEPVYDKPGLAGKTIVLDPGMAAVIQVLLGRPG